jgi:hypothetical protein
MELYKVPWLQLRGIITSREVLKNPLFSRNTHCHGFTLLTFKRSSLSSLSCFIIDIFIALATTHRITVQSSILNIVSGKVNSPPPYYQY